MTMKAVSYQRFGIASDVLEYGDLPEPEAGPGEVRVRLHASGVNPADTVLMRGLGQLVCPRIIPNSDGAGVIDQVGRGVTRFIVGQRVWLYNGQRNGRAFGTAAQYIALDERLVTPLPDTVSFIEGATLGIPCLTAWVALFRDGPIAGQTVLVTGGAGAVGHYAIQLAKHGGARVITTISSQRKADIVRAAGADEVLDYTREDVAARVSALTDGRGVERIVEVEFGKNLRSSLAAVALNGTIASYASTGEPNPVLPFDTIKGKNITIQGFRLPLVPRALCEAGQSDVLKWLHAGTRIHNVDSVHRLPDTIAAHQAVAAGTKLGTVVVDCLST